MLGVQDSPTASLQTPHTRTVHTVSKVTKDDFPPHSSSCLCTVFHMSPNREKLITATTLPIPLPVQPTTHCIYNQTHPLPICQIWCELALRRWQTSVSWRVPEHLAARGGRCPEGFQCLWPWSVAQEARAGPATREVESRGPSSGNSLCISALGLNSHQFLSQVAAWSGHARDVQ